MPPRPPKQEVCWVLPTKRVALENRPARVWTLILRDGHDPERPPALPIVPQHLMNAFLEERMHDWTWANSELRYFSRVAEHSVWILVEFDVE
jgi:hypothetical protein